MSIAIVCPSRTDEFLARLLGSIELSEPGSVTEGRRHIVIGDNGLSRDLRNAYPLVQFVEVPEPFIFSQAINLCAGQLAPSDDMMVCNDDTAFETEVLLPKLEQIMALPSAAAYGVLSPKINGGAGSDDMWKPKGPGVNGIVLTREPICFVAAVIRHEAWKEIGGLDERFIYYGFDDTDGCRRIVNGGWNLGVIPSLIVKHGFDDGRVQSGTYARVFNPIFHAEMGQRAWKLFREKWGDGPQLGAYSGEA